MPTHDETRGTLDLVPAANELGRLMRSIEPGDLERPASVAGNATLQELLLHGWDLARATGQRYTPDQVSVTDCSHFLSSLSEEARAQPFAASIELPSGSTDLDRLLALSGRSPRWRPPQTA